MTSARISCKRPPSAGLISIKTKSQFIHNAHYRWSWISKSGNKILRSTKLSKEVHPMTKSKRSAKMLTNNRKCEVSKVELAKWQNLGKFMQLPMNRVR